MGKDKSEIRNTSEEFEVKVDVLHGSLSYPPLFAIAMLLQTKKWNVVHTIMYLDDLDLLTDTMAEVEKKSHS